MRCSFIFTLINTVSLLVFASPVSAQVDGERDRAAATLENGRLEAALYVIRPEPDDQKPIKLNAESLLKWQITVDKTVHGNMLVWMKEGRPELVASIYQFYSPKNEIDAELHSPALGPLVIEKEGVRLWTPKEAGVVLKNFDDSSAPADSKPQRLIKMRQLAEQFTGQMTDWSNETYRLRLMPQPLFRYESTDPQVLDGALFALTYTTDPEVLVLVEARKTDKGFRWMYGLARMNVGELKVSQGDREIWNAPRLKHPFFYKDGNYTLFTDMPLPKSRPKVENAASR